MLNHRIGTTPMPHDGMRRTGFKDPKTVAAGEFTLLRASHSREILDIVTQVLDIDQSKTPKWDDLQPPTAQVSVCDLYANHRRLTEPRGPVIWLTPANSSPVRPEFGRIFDLPTSRGR